MDLRTSFNFQMEIAEGTSVRVNETLLETGTGTKMWPLILLYIQRNLQCGFVPDQLVFSQIISLHIWGLSVGQGQFLLGNLGGITLFWGLRQFSSTHTTSLSPLPSGPENRSWHYSFH